MVSRKKIVFKITMKIIDLINAGGVVGTRIGSTFVNVDFAMSPFKSSVVTITFISIDT